MSGPNPLFLLFFYEIYRKKFLNNPNNVGKQPQGCFVWSLLFLLKFAAIVVAFILALYVIMFIGELF